MEQFCHSPSVARCRQTEEALSSQYSSELGTELESQNSLASKPSTPNTQVYLPSENSLAFMGSQSSLLSSLDSSPSQQSQGSLFSTGSFTDSYKNSPQSQVSVYSLSSHSSSPLEGQLKLQGNFVYGCLSTLAGHVGLISSVFVDGELLYCGASQGNDIRTWRYPDLVECGRFGCGEGAVKAILVAGEKVFSAHQDHKIRVWRRSGSQPGGHKLVATLPTLKDYLMKCVSQKNYVQVRRHHNRLWIEHVDTISVLAIGKNNKLLYSGSWDKTVKVWRLSDLKCLESIQAHDDAVNALVVSADEFVYTASADSKVKVWTKKLAEKKHSLVTTLEGHKSAVNALALSRDGECLYSGGSDSLIIVWGREVGDTSHMSPLTTLKGHRLPILCLCRAGDLLCSGSADKTVRVWCRGILGNMFSCVAVLEGHKGPIKSISVSADLGAGCLIYTGSLDKTTKVWCVSHAKEKLLTRHSC